MDWRNASWYFRNIQDNTGRQKSTPFNGPYPIFALKRSNRRLDHRGWRDIENDVASEVHAKRPKSKEVRVKTLQYAFILLCADGSYFQGGHAQRQTLLLQRADSFDAGAVSSTLSATRSDPCSLQSVTLCKKKAEVQMFLKLIATLWKRDVICGVRLENLFIATTSCFENNCLYRRSHPSQILSKIHSRRETDNQFGKFRREYCRLLSENCGGSTRFRILNKWPLSG